MKFSTTLVTFIVSTLSYAQLTVNPEFGNPTDCSYLTQGAFAVWWDNQNNMSVEAQMLLDSLVGIREDCTQDLGMQDPPCVPDGFYCNIYLHEQGDIYPNTWGNGVGTEHGQYPYLALPLSSTGDFVNFCHEAFHLFQYGANSPGFEYAGDSGWYIEGSANWYAAYRNKLFDGAFIEGYSLVSNPQITMWTGYDNFPSWYPQNWQRYVHQYAMANFLFYLTEVKNVDVNLITHGFFTNSNKYPQEYLGDSIGPELFKDYFVDWAAQITNDFDFLTQDQFDRLVVEWNDYADPNDIQQFVGTYTDYGTNGWISPSFNYRPGAWSFNVLKLNNSVNDDYTFSLLGDLTGNEGTPSIFEARVIAVNNGIGTIHELNMQNDFEGNLTLTLNNSDSEAYFVIAAVPDNFSGTTELFNYQAQIERASTIGIEENPNMNDPVQNRYNLLGQPVLYQHSGITIDKHKSGKTKLNYSQKID